jgi:hypothetical protein
MIPYVIESPAALVSQFRYGVKRCAITGAPSKFFADPAMIDVGDAVDVLVMFTAAVIWK